MLWIYLANRLASTEAGWTTQLPMVQAAWFPAAMSGRIKGHVQLQATQQRWMWALLSNVFDERNYFYIRHQDKTAPHYHCVLARAVMIPPAQEQISWLGLR